jgi:hypothetical protein
VIENLDGMSSEQLMLRDIIYELYDFLDEAGKNKDTSYRMGVYSVVKILAEQMKSFNIDQSRFARQMPDIDLWLARSV